MPIANPCRNDGININVEYIAMFLTSEDDRHLPVRNHNLKLDYSGATKDNHNG